MSDEEKIIKLIKLLVALKQNKNANANTILQDAKLIEVTQDTQYNTLSSGIKLFEERYGLNFDSVTEDFPTQNTQEFLTYIDHCFNPYLKLIKQHNGNFKVDFALDDASIKWKIETTKIENNSIEHFIKPYTPDLKTATVLDVIDHAVTVAPESRRKTILSDIVKRLLKNKEDLALNDEQVEAIAYLTGIVPEEYPSKFIEDKIKTKNYVTKNFLNNDQPLKFNFEKELLILQLVTRIIEPERVNQKSEQVCGPAAYIYSIAAASPMDYVKYVTELATQGESTLRLQDNAEGLPVKARSELYNQSSRQKVLTENPDGNPLSEVDFLAMIGLRASQNTMIKYQPDSGELRNSLFGVSLAGEIKKWKKATGYKNVEIIDVKTSDDIKRLNLLLQDGYSITFNTTVNLTDHSFDTDNELKNDNKIKQLLDGHFIQIKSIDYIEEQQKKYVELSIVSWGKQSEKVRIEFEKFQAVKGLSKAIVGITPQAAVTLESVIPKQQTFGKRMHPIAYINHVRSNILNGEWDLSNLFDSQKETFHLKTGANIALPKPIYNLLEIIESSKKHLGAESWYESAKKLQDAVYHLVTNKKLADYNQELLTQIVIFTRENLEPSITHNAEATHRLWQEIENPANTDKKENLLLSAVELKDFESALTLINFYIEHNRLEDASNLFEETKAWTNDNEKYLLSTPIERAIKSKENEYVISDMYLNNIKIELNIVRSFFNESSGKISYLTNEEIKTRVISQLNKHAHPLLKYNFSAEDININSTNDGKTLASFTRENVIMFHFLENFNQLNNKQKITQLAKINQVFTRNEIEDFFKKIEKPLDIKQKEQLESAQNFIIKFQDKSSENKQEVYKLLKQIEICLKSNRDLTISLKNQFTPDLNKELISKFIQLEKFYEIVKKRYQHFTHPNLLDKLFTNEQQEYTKILNCSAELLKTLFEYRTSVIVNLGSTHDPKFEAIKQELSKIKLSLLSTINNNAELAETKRSLDQSSQELKKNNQAITDYVKNTQTVPFTYEQEKKPTSSNNTPTLTKRMF